MKKKIFISSRTQRDSALFLLQLVLETAGGEGPSAVSATGDQTGSLLQLSYAPDPFLRMHRGCRRGSGFSRVLTQVNLNCRSDYDLKKIKIQ